MSTGEGGRVKKLAAEGGVWRGRGGQSWPPKAAPRVKKLKVLANLGGGEGGKASASSAAGGQSLGQSFAVEQKQYLIDFEILSPEPDIELCPRSCRGPCLSRPLSCLACSRALAVLADLTEQLQRRPKMGFLSKLKRLDAYRKIEADLTKGTVSGASLSLASVAETGSSALCRDAHGGL